jgi:uncharacterized membrane protein
MSATTNAAATPTATTASRRRFDGLTTAILIVTLIGLADAAYLTYVHYHGFSALACVGGHNGHSSCQTVQSSRWSTLDGVPVALLGLIGYVTLLVSLFIKGELGRAIGFGVALIGFGFSAYLTYREAASIHAYCEWCLGSAVALTILAVLTGIRFVRGEPTQS